MVIEPGNDKVLLGGMVIADHATRAIGDFQNDLTTVISRMIRLERFIAAIDWQLLLEREQAASWRNVVFVRSANCRP
jgi:hypothetical protein